MQQNSISTWGGGGKQMRIQGVHGPEALTYFVS